MAIDTQEIYEKEMKTNLNYICFKHSFEDLDRITRSVELVSCAVGLLIRCKLFFSYLHLFNSKKIFLNTFVTLNK